MIQDDEQPPAESDAIGRSYERARRALLGGRTAMLLDVDAEHVDDVLEEVARAIANDESQSNEYLEAVRESLSRNADSGPDVLDGGVGIVHDRVRGVEGPVVDVLVRTAKPLALRDGDGQSVRFLWVLISGEATHPHVGAAAEFAQLMHHGEFAEAAHVAETPDELVAAFEHALRLEVGFGRMPPELERTGKLFGGIARDLRRRLPWWVDDFRAGLRIKVLASVLFMFVACLAPAVAFGGLLSTLTGGQIGAVETLLASAVCGVLWALFAGQPLPIVGATGPNVIFTGILFGLCERFDVPFLPTVAWTGLWAGVFLLVLAATDASALIRYFTRFTDEIFAALIALIFISEAVSDLGGAFADPAQSPASQYFSLLLALGTFGVAISLSHFRRRPYLRPKMREFLSDFGPAIAITTMTLFALASDGVQLPTLDAPDHFAPSVERDWLVDPLAAPKWVWVASAVPAILLTILIWVNQNITARLANSPDYKLEKGPAFHWDIALMGLLVGLMGMFGLPWVVGAVVRSLNHVKSLTVTDDQGRTIGVLENRVSNLTIHLLMGAAVLFFLPWLAVIPMAVLFGLFLFMGFGTLGGNQFVDRLKLWITDPNLYPPTHYLRAVPGRVVHLFTGVQLGCLTVLWMVKASVIGILFPFFVALLVPVRMLLAKTLRPHHLALLDAEEGPADEQYREID
jgi:mannitol/fructose-specific phosphotransferase system IIA component (Ntr-type)